MQQKTRVRLAFSGFLFLSLFLVAGGINKSFGQNKGDTSIFYKVSGNGLNEPSFLLGTYHLLGDAYLKQFPVIKTEMAMAKGMVVETVIDSAKIPAMQRMGLLEQGTLSALLDKPFADSLETILKEALGVSLPVVEQLKPASLMLTISLIYNMRDNDSLLKAFPGEPMDVYVANTCKLQGKKLTSLETLEAQMNLLFNSESMEKQVDNLKSFIRNFETGRALGNELVKSYLRHNLPEMDKVAEKAMAISGNSDHLLKDRNNNWIKVLPGLMKQESQFIAVGALHLSGKDGLLTQLRNLGYSVNPIKLY